MVLISLVFLFVYLFGAYAYGAAMVFSLRRISKVWNRHAEDGASAETRRIDWPSMALLTISTVWFVLHTLIEFRQLTGDSPQNDLLDLGTLMVFLFPPVIMHTVYRESHSDGEPAPIFRYLLTAMYVVAPALGLQNGRLFGAFGTQNRCLLLAVGGQNFRAPFTLGLHLTRHRFGDVGGRLQILDFDARRLDAPRLRRRVDDAQ